LAGTALRRVVAICAIVQHLRRPFPCGALVLHCYECPREPFVVSRSSVIDDADLGAFPRTVIDEP
jgi:hypothetical protein